MFRVKNIVLAISCLIIMHGYAFAYVDKYDPRGTGSAWDFYLYLILMGCVFIGYLIKKIINNKNIRVPIKRSYISYRDKISNKIKQTIDKDLTERFQGLDNNLPIVKKLRKMCFEGLLAVYPDYDNEVIKNALLWQ